MASHLIDKKNQTLDNVPGMWRCAIKLPGSQSTGFKLSSLKQIYSSSVYDPKLKSLKYILYILAP